eukprot:TRINITY_DN9837_c4_g1_i1.p1 TRINITY_DN9837_c4_g1~~TRINITY_DN9837_c4_g1_i1.p1  ORF type:complete len:357 (+),score=77.68 TRINITY_DN9837_c4_g1_i1:89-1072(+)
MENKIVRETIVLCPDPRNRKKKPKRALAVLVEGPATEEQKNETSPKEDTPKETPTTQKREEREPQAKKQKSLTRVYPDAPTKPENTVKAKPHKVASSTLGKLEAQLKSGKFRWLNEKMYTGTSEDSSGMFNDDPGLFEAYHEGYREQVEKWPANPLTVITNWLKAKGSKSKRVVCADLGCGDGLLAYNLRNSNIEVHSFDLVSKASHIVSCDITKKVPLPSCSVDFVVISLALMGTNWIEILKEANRVLVPGGSLKIAEVTSRFQSDVHRFLHLLSALGFKAGKPNSSNTHFILIDATKEWSVEDDTRDRVPRDASSYLSPCVYKKR